MQQLYTHVVTDNNNDNGTPQPSTFVPMYSQQTTTSHSLHDSHIYHEQHNVENSNYIELQNVNRSNYIQNSDLQRQILQELKFLR